MLHSASLMPWNLPEFEVLHHDFASIPWPKSIEETLRAHCFLSAYFKMVRLHSTKLAESRAWHKSAGKRIKKDPETRSPTSNTYLMSFKVRNALMSCCMGLDVSMQTKSNVEGTKTWGGVMG